MVFNLNNVDTRLVRGLEILRDDLKITFADSGIKVDAIKGDVFKVEFDGTQLNVTYKFQTEVFRAFSMVKANGYKPFVHSGNRYFNDFGIHCATTPSYSPKVTHVKKLLRKFALMGYSQFQLYMHSNFTIDGEPYFGYGGARYDKSELKEIAEYGSDLCIDVIPCLETLAHQRELKQWRVYEGMYDWDDVFNVGLDKTYELIEKMIATVSECFKSSTINLGMDEAYMLGCGKYLFDHEYTPRLELFLTHLNKVVKIAEKYGYTRQIIWSDMLYTSVNKNHYYWGPNQLPNEVIKRIPSSVTLAYWDYYGTDNDHYNWCMKNHVETGKRVMFAGGVWSWNGSLTHNRFSMQILEMAFGYCRNNGINDLLITSWGHGFIFQLIPSLCFASALAYGETALTAKKLFNAIMNCDFDDFLLLDTPNYLTHDQCYVTPVADQVLYNDYFIGLLDSEVRVGKSDIWLKHISSLIAVKSKVKEYSVSVDKCIALCKICYLKYELGVKTRKAYKDRDKAQLKKLIKLYYKPLIPLYEDYLLKREKEWNSVAKSTAFESEVAYIGAMIQRTKHCILRLTAFINGKIDVIDELETDVLDIKGNGTQFNHNSWFSESNFKNIYAPSVR